MTLDAMREELHLYAKNAGAMVGNITLVDSGDEIDCTRMGSGGYSIPSIVEPEVVQFKKCTAKFILHVEKDTVWRRFAEDKFWQKHNCLVTHGSGQPPRGVRRMLHRLHNELKLPVYCLLDNDPWGYYIYSVIKQGSINLAYESRRMAIPGARFLGLRSNDFERCKLSNSVQIKLNEQDIKRAKQIAEYPWFKDKKAWQKEIDLMLKNGFKLEVESLISIFCLRRNDAFTGSIIHRNERTSPVPHLRSESCGGFTGSKRGEGAWHATRATVCLQTVREDGSHHQRHRSIRRLDQTPTSCRPSTLLLRRLRSSGTTNHDTTIKQGHLSDLRFCVTVKHHSPTIGLAAEWPSDSVEFGLNPHDLVVFRNHSDICKDGPRWTKFVFVINVGIVIGFAFIVLDVRTVSCFRHRVEAIFCRCLVGNSDGEFNQQRLRHVCTLRGEISQDCTISVVGVSCHMYSCVSFLGQSAFVSLFG